MPPLMLVGSPVLIDAAGRVLAILAPPPKLTISQWADKFRVLSPEASAEPGQWHTDRAPYLRDIMDAVCDPTIERVAAMLASQVGKTEAVLNILGYYIHQDPAPVLVLLPTIEMAATFSLDRLAPMLRDSPALRGKVAAARARDSGNTKLHKTFRGGHLTMAGANSAASLSARPIRILLCDEVDRYPASAGSEGDPLLLARNRTRTFWNRKQVEISSPTIAGVSRIDASYDVSDRRKFWVPCPHCGEQQTLEWERVRWTDNDASTARYYCVECGAAWTDQQRLAAVRRGAWRASAPFHGIAGFHLSELYTPWRRLDQIVQEFIDAKGRPTQLKVFKNTVLALPWQEAGEAPDWERLIERREPIPMGEVPAQAVAVTVGVDNQIDRIEAATWAWAAGYESWLVDTKVFMGNPGQAAVWDALIEYLNEELPVTGGGTMRIERIGVDTGGAYTTAIYGHLRRLRDRRIVALKGVESWNKAAPVTGPTLVDVLENGRKLKRGLRLWTVAVSTFKTDLYRRLWLTRGDGVGYPPGWVHLPEGLGPEEIKQLVAEQLVTVNDKRGFPRQEWHKLRDRNEQLDMAVYARAALTMLGADRYGEKFWLRARRGQPATPSDLPRPMPVGTGDDSQPGATPQASIMRTPGTPARTRGSLGSRLA